jgi:DNA processing protein
MSGRPATFRSLINHFGSAESALQAIPALSRQGGANRSIRIAGVGEAEDEMRAAQRCGAQFVALGEPDYPPWLRHADAPPPLLAVRGGTGYLTSPAIAIVGARNASVAGRKMAATLAQGLGEAGFVVVSGLARGIDAAAHEAALANGTVAVFAGGIDIVYPPENGALADRIMAEGGCCVSEMRLGWEPRARDFPRRNRIIAGLSLGTVVVEAAERSGSLITARLALEQNREVLAVPGSPLDPRAAGSNNLLKQGARLVTEARDVIDAVRHMLDCEPGEPVPRSATRPGPALSPSLTKATAHAFSRRLGRHRSKWTRLSASRGFPPEQSRFSCLSLISPGDSNAIRASAYRLPDR